MMTIPAEITTPGNRVLDFILPNPDLERQSQVLLGLAPS
jgi:hypothetical protein